MPTNPDLLNGLRAFWKMTESTGTRADSTGNYDLSENGGTVSGGNFSSQFYADRFNGPVSVFGGTPNLNRTNGTDLRVGSNPMTVTAWFTFAALGSNQALMGKWFTETNGLEWVIQWSPSFPQGFSARLGYGSASDASQTVVCTAAGSGNNNNFFTLNQWYFVAVRFIPNGCIQMKINNGDWSTQAFPYSVISGVSRFAIGSWCSSGGSRFSAMNGRVANVGIWGKMLQDSDIGNLWNGGNGLDYDFSYF